MDRNWQELKGSRAAGTHSNMVRTDIFKMDPLAHLILGKNYQWKSNLGLTFPHVKFTQNLSNSYKTGQKLTRSFSVFYSTETSTTTHTARRIKCVVNTNQQKLQNKFFLFAKFSYFKWPHKIKCVVNTNQQRGPK